MGNLFKKQRAVTQCPRLGSILYLVQKSDGTPLANATVNISGPTPGTRQTDAQGFAEFPNLTPGDYTAEVTLTGGSLKLIDWDDRLSVSAGSGAHGIATANAVGHLKIEVFDDLGNPVKDVVQFAVQGGVSGSERSQGRHLTTFAELPAGLYTASALVPAEMFSETQTSKDNIKVPEGGTAQARLVFIIENTAKPKISIDKTEIRTYVQSPDNPQQKASPHSFVGKGAADFPIEVAKISLSFSETRTEKPYKEDGWLSIVGGKVEVFSDAECKTPLVAEENGYRIANGQLKSGTQVYIPGKSAALVTASLSLIAPQNPHIKVAPQVSAPLEIKPYNIVTPKIEVEYKVVLLERDLSKHQKLSDSKEGTGPALDQDKLKADATLIWLSASQSLQDPAYTGGGKVEFSPANVKVYTDEACKTVFDASKPLTHAQLFGAESPYKLYLRGDKPGLFKITLTLDPSNNGLIKVKDQAEADMGVVELKLKVHHFVKASVNQAVDPDVADPNTYWDQLKGLVLDQTALSDEKKITPGRLLHKQATMNNGRAKLIVEKLDGSQWPADTDQYSLVLESKKARDDATGSVALFDKEIDGTQQALPLQIEVSQGKTKDHEFWLEGTATSIGWRDVRLDLGLTRPVEGPVRVAKQHGDFAHFTAVEIESVRVDYTRPVGKANAWEDPKFFINFETDPNGRKITIGAQLKPKLKDVEIHHMLAEDKDNRKVANWGVDMPNTWPWHQIDVNVKHKDKDDRLKLLHKSAQTNANGYAKSELVLSRFGGDKFQPSAYIDQDPHLAKYIHGHADLEKRKPAFSPGLVEVWRKFWYQEVRVQGINVAGFFNAADTYEDVKVVMEAAPVVTMPRATADSIAPRVIYPKHMISYYSSPPGSNNFINNYPGDLTDGLVVGDNNETRFFGLANPAADKPVMIPVMNVHGLWIADGNSLNANSNWVDPNVVPFPITLTANKQMLDPPLQGGRLLLAGTWEACEWDPTAAGGAGDWGNYRTGNLAHGNASLDPNRSSPFEVKISRPAALVIDPTKATRIRIIASFRCGTNFLGTSYADGIVNAYTPNDLVDFVNTVNHELAHSFKQVTTIRPAGIPPHPNQYNQQGSHCSYPVAVASRNSTDCTCVMFESGPVANPLNRFCPVCHPYVLVQNWRK